MTCSRIRVGTTGRLTPISPPRVKGADVLRPVVVVSQIKADGGRLYASDDGRSWDAKTKVPTPRFSASSDYGAGGESVRANRPGVGLVRALEELRVAVLGAVDFALGSNRQRLAVRRQLPGGGFGDRTFDLAGALDPSGRRSSSATPSGTRRCRSRPSRRRPLPLPAGCRTSSGTPEPGRNRRAGSGGRKAKIAKGYVAVNSRG